MKFCVFVLACALANATPVPSKVPNEILNQLVGLPPVRSGRSTSVLPEVPAIPEVEEKPAPVVLVSASSPSEATPILRSYVAPSEAFVPVAPVASFTPAPAFVNVPKYVANARDAQTIQYSNDISPNGAFNYFFETNNGIAAQAEGVPRSFYSGADEVSPIVEQGSFAWISPDGQEIYTSYTADENGYQPTGNAIPQPPEIPPAILRALEFIARSRSAIASTK